MRTRRSYSAAGRLDRDEWARRLVERMERERLRERGELRAEVRPVLPLRVALWGAGAVALAVVLSPVLSALVYFFASVGGAQ